MAVPVWGGCLFQQYMLSQGDKVRLISPFTYGYMELGIIVDCIERPKYKDNIYIVELLNDARLRTYHEKTIKIVSPLSK